MRTIWRKHLKGSLNTLLLYACASAFPAVGLLPINRTLGKDGEFQMWMLGYFGEYFRAHGSFPVSFYTDDIIGLHYPVFYGNLFFPPLGLFAGFVNPQAVMKLAIVGLLALQFYNAKTAIKAAGADSRTAAVVALLISWAIYPLTNIFTRGALPEFFATGLLSCTLCALVLFILEREPSSLLRKGLIFSLYLTLTAGCHPITALYSTPILFLMGVMIYFSIEPGVRVSLPRLLKALLPGVLLFTVVMFPWLYVVKSFKGKLATYMSTIPAAWYSPEGLDSFMSRISPLPMDVRSLTRGVMDVENSSPHLDLQINLALLIFVATLIVAAARESGFSKRTWAGLAVGASGLALSFWISISHVPLDYLPAEFELVQFGYRLITYVNLFMFYLAIICFLGRRTGQQSTTPIRFAASFPILATCCLTLAGTGVMIKWLHHDVVTRRQGEILMADPIARTQNRLRSPPLYFVTWDYAAPETYPRLNIESGKALKRISFQIDKGANWGAPFPVEINNTQPQWIGTNVQTFPWNQLVIDGIPASEVLTYEGEQEGNPLEKRGGKLLLAILVPAGRHTISVREAADPVWNISRNASYILLAVWVLLVSLWRTKRPWPHLD